MSELLRKLVSIPSESGNEGKAVDFLVDEMKEKGFKAKKDRAGNAIGVIGKGKKQILLAGHIDTVKGQLPVKVSKGFVFGRGAVDAKASLAAFVEAGEEFLNSEDVQIIVAGCVCEESDSKGAHFLKKELMPSTCIVGEPSGAAAITIGYRGRISLECRARGKVFHAGHGQENAIDELINFYNKLRQEFTEEKVGFSNSNASLSEINSKSDGIVQECNARIDVRTALGFNSKKFHSFLNSYSSDNKIKILEELQAVKADKNSYLARAFISAIREQGLSPSYKVKTGSCDMNIFAEEWNCPIIAYGPGDSKLDHTNKEKVSLKEYELAKRILTTALNK